ncbi:MULTISPECIES: indole-3-glycerol phosphate synthase TrpC [Aerococcus]|uniref:Indole-3-glycerol phosphate synthase n=1 Tax=Aerococcus tenax TaxID=3078812 RepID=A0A5N1BH40_9LACT|nr:indole-3-glycerol phosphate synthase TrpC [Aerococcus urinae]KAA9239457.1 indole-3-glycerol phosphate synthase TrpC [Aerococcus urinae]MDK6370527.1 indole-3-glycerol phosphate synthase TrpC [Aerococcus urinae]MDK6596801.1 indole-3-glycerol phosphate synthase TrpC [Aerococcus urinae]MDK7302265.1 indole-3-glycerol phosphate synthase TrpC [Aerococcus urinae]MDK7800783.1 indole-3-glycerol phosphate synthase TrpC [Aerococcus urinae]
MILKQLALHSKERVQNSKAQLPFEAIKDRALSLAKGQPIFEQALAKGGLSIIAEIKKASPSKGIISQNFPYLEIAKNYQANQVDAISVLTEPKWFLGSKAIFEEVRQAVDLPLLRKDFTVDPYQIYEAKIMGANAVLIICSLLGRDPGQLENYLSICNDLGLSALVETHNLEEIDLALASGAKIIGVNNRNLKDFSVDFNHAAELRSRIPDSVLFVAESGVRGPEDIASLNEIGADAVLVGEALMRHSDPSALIQAFRKVNHHAQA